MVMSVSLDVYDSVVFKMFIFTTMNSTTTQRRLSMSCIAYFLVGLMQHASNQPKLLASQAYSQEGLQQALKRLKAARGPEERDNTTQLISRSSWQQPLPDAVSKQQPSLYPAYLSFSGPSVCRQPQLIAPALLGRTNPNIPYLPPRHDEAIHTQTRPLQSSMPIQQGEDHGGSQPHYLAGQKQPITNYHSGASGSGSVLGGGMAAIRGNGVIPDDSSVQDFEESHPDMYSESQGYWGQIGDSPAVGCGLPYC